MAPNCSDSPPTEGLNALCAASGLAVTAPSHEGVRGNNTGFRDRQKRPGQALPPCHQDAGARRSVPPCCTYAYVYVHAHVHTHVAHACTLTVCTDLQTIVGAHDPLETTHGALPPRVGPGMGNLDPVSRSVSLPCTPFPGTKAEARRTGTSLGLQAELSLSWSPSGQGFVSPTWPAGGGGEDIVCCTPGTPPRLLYHFPWPQGQTPITPALFASRPRHPFHCSPQDTEPDKQRVHHKCLWKERLSRTSESLQVQALPHLPTR